MACSQERIVTRFDTAPPAWFHHKNWHHDLRNTWYFCGYGYDDSSTSHRHEDSRPHVSHSPRMNTSAIGSIPATSSRTRRINRTSHSASLDRDCRGVQQSSIPQPFGRALRTVASRKNPTHPNRSPLSRDLGPWDYHPQPNLRVKELQVDDHVSLQLWDLQAAC